MQHIKYNFTHAEFELFEAWNSSTPDHGLVLCLNVGSVEFVGKPIFFEIPCARFIVIEDEDEDDGPTPVTLSYYPPETLTAAPGYDAPSNMHVFIRSPKPITDATLSAIGYIGERSCSPEEWTSRYEATTKHLTSITLKR